MNNRHTILFADEFDRTRVTWDAKDKCLYITDDTTEETDGAFPVEMEKLNNIKRLRDFLNQILEMEKVK